MSCEYLELISCSSTPTLGSLSPAPVLSDHLFASPLRQLIVIHSPQLVIFGPTTLSNLLLHLSQLSLLDITHSITNASLQNEIFESLTRLSLPLGEGETRRLTVKGLSSNRALDLDLAVAAPPTIVPS
jgi:hypothetical protein